MSNFNRTETEIRGVAALFEDKHLGQFVVVAPDAEALAAVAKAYDIKMEPGKNHEVVVSKVEGN